MLIVLLVLMLSKPGEPVVFGVAGEFKTQSECIQFVSRLEETDDFKARLSGIQVVKPREV